MEQLYHKADEFIRKYFPSYLYWYYYTHILKRLCIVRVGALIVISFHGVNKLYGKQTLNDYQKAYLIEVLFELILYVHSEIQFMYPIILGGDFNISMDRVYAIASQIYGKISYGNKYYKKSVTYKCIDGFFVLDGKEYVSTVEHPNELQFSMLLKDFRILYNGKVLHYDHPPMLFRLSLKRNYGKSDSSYDDLDDDDEDDDSEYESDDESDSSYDDEDDDEDDSEYDSYDDFFGLRKLKIY